MTDRGLRIGGLFEGYGGLTMAVQEVLGGELAWYSENNPAASKVLAHHHPGVPNLGDITQIDWDQVAPVDILAGGFPCQDVSSAGRRAGMSAGNRSGLWAHMATAVDHLRPQLVVIENVRGLTSARADCDLEPCPWCLGDDEDVHLRALGCVLGDLADIGYDAQWCGLRAADVGAPHGRYRIFVVAVPSVARGVGSNAAGNGRDEGRPEPTRVERGLDAAISGAVAAANTTSQRHGNTRASGIGGIQAAAVAGDQREAAADTAGTRWGQSGGVASGQAQGAGSEARRSAGRGGGAPAADADRAGLEGSESAAGRVVSVRGAPSDSCGIRRGTGESHVLAGQPDAARSSLDWGQFQPAVRRWEGTLGRPAPEPTVLSERYLAMLRRRLARKDPRPAGMRGPLRPSRVLSPRFVEWLMGLSEGHVTGVPGLSRNDMLRLLGNGVVSQQAEAALRWLLLAIVEERAA